MNWYYNWASAVYKFISKGFFMRILVIFFMLFSVAFGTPRLISPLDLVEVQKLSEPNVQNGEQFAKRIAMYGNMVAVGVPYKTVDGKSHAGMVYLYMWNASISGYEKVAVLKASDAQSWDRFGESVAMTDDVVVVGAPGKESNNKGGVYLFVKPASGWGDMSETAQLSATDIDGDDHFGSSVTVEESVIVVGAKGADSYTGAAYVYVKPSSGWDDMNETAKLTASDGGNVASFGVSLAISGDTIVIGAEGSNYDAGAAYVFTKTGSEWSTMTQTAKLMPSDSGEYMYFGSSVAIKNDMIAIGARGDDEVYLFFKPASSGWQDTTEDATLTPSGTRVGFKRFGTSVQIGENAIVVGASNQDKGSLTQAGAVYVYVRPENGWHDMTETFQIASPNAENQGYFGISMAFEGTRLLVGAYGEDNERGSAYLFSLAAVQRTLEGQTAAMALQAEDDSGLSVNFSIVSGEDSRFFTIGASSGRLYFAHAPDFEQPGDINRDNIYALTIRVANSFHVERQYRTYVKVMNKIYEGASPNIGMLHKSKIVSAPNNIGSGAFGEASDISGDTLAVGAPRIGRVYLYTYNTAMHSYEKVATLSASDPTSGDIFGSNVAVNGDTVIVGVHDKEDRKGVVYLFVKPEGGWHDMTETARLLASERSDEDDFGISVDIDGDTVAVGATGVGGKYGVRTGAVYLFEKPENGWHDMNETAILSPSDGLQNDNFGNSVAIEGDTVVVGDRYKNNTTGAAYVFEKPMTGWCDMTERAKLTASDADASDFFGQDVAISGQTVVVGAHKGDANNVAKAGAAYVFEKPTIGWHDMNETSKLAASDGNTYDYFGTSVAIENDTVVVGATRQDVNGKDASGAVYVFRKNQLGWSHVPQQMKLTADVAQTEDNLGASVIINAGTVFAGAPNKGDNDAGALYLFKAPPVFNPSVLMYLLN